MLVFIMDKAETKNNITMDNDYNNDTNLSN